MSALVAFLIDLVEGAVLGAALAVLALPDDLGDGRAAVVAVLAGAIAGVKFGARRAVRAYVEARKDRLPS